MMKKLMGLSGLSFALLASGCAMGPPSTSPADLGSEYELEQSEANPSPKGSKANKVVLFEVDDGGLDAVNEAKLQTAVMSELDSAIGDAGAKIVERDLASGLEEEIERAEMTGEGAYEGAPVADYAVRTRVTEAAFGSSFSEAYVDDDGDKHPARCRYEGNVSVTVDVYTVPELERVKSLTGDDSSSTSEETRSSNCNGVSGNGLLRSAAAGSVTDIQGQLQNFFAPVGYITRATHYEPDDESVALKTSLTPELGAEPGGDVNIMRVKANGDRYKVAAGEIGAPVLGSGAVVVIDKENAEKVKVGDEIVTDYSCSFMGCEADEMLSF